MAVGRGGPPGGPTVVVETAWVAGRGVSVADVVAEHVAGNAPVLLGIDAPLGWPEPLARELSSHRAGEALGTTDRHAMFRRATDQVVKRVLGKQPLDVGADRIARTAFAALAMLQQLRQLTGWSIPLGWAGPETPGPAAAIETYPAGTLAALGIRARGYKADRAVRETLLDTLESEGHVDLPADREAMLASDDALDAALCVLTGALFLAGACLEPAAENGERARVEGWVWFPHNG